MEFLEVKHMESEMKKIIVGKKPADYKYKK